MRAALFVVCVALAAAANNASAVSTKSKRADHNRSSKHVQAPRPGSSSPFRIANWASLNDQSPTKPLNETRLNIDVVSDGVEDITVYGKRLRRTEQKPTDDNPAILLGPVTVTGTTHSDQANFSGVKITGAIPIGGVPGLEAVMNVTGGYDQINASTTASSAAATIGLRLKF